jgi:choline dehydrogenase-like flavoprotein
MPIRTDFDVVIIGSGAGGSPIAHELVLAGKDVLIFEKGPMLQPQFQSPDQLSAFKRDELYSTGPEKRIQLDGVVNKGAAYYSSHVEPDINDEPHVYRTFDGNDKATIEGYTAQVVGGGTQLYGGVSYRFTMRDLKLKSANEARTLVADPNGDVKREARDWPVSYDELEPYYAKAETLVGINGQVEGQIKDFKGKDCYQKPLPPNPISAHVEAGMDALGFARYRTPLAVITEDHVPSGRKGPVPGDSAKTAYVNRYGDPLGFKSNTYVSLLRPILDRPNVEIRANCVVTHLACTGRLVTDVHYRDPAGSPRIARGKIVVVACSAIESIRLLMLSAKADPAFDRAVNQDGNGMLGAYFLTHCFGGASALVAAPQRYDKSLTLDSDWSSDHCATDEFLDDKKLWAGAAIYNNTSDRALPLALGRNYGSRDLDSIWQAFVDDAAMTGQALDDFLDANLGRGLSMTFMANQVPVKTNRIALHPTVTDKWGRPAAHIIKGWHSHDIALMQTLAPICADVLRRGGVTNDLGEGGVFGNDDLARCANHILGGARFGTDPKDSVLDKDCRAWGFDNLYVTDGASFPTSGGGNPTLTIQANSFRIADALKLRI